MYFVTDQIMGVLDSSCAFETEEEAKAFIAELEAKDNGIHEEGFYVIIEADLEDAEDWDGDEEEEDEGIFC